MNFTTVVIRSVLNSREANPNQSKICQISGKLNMLKQLIRQDVRNWIRIYDTIIIVYSCKANQWNIGIPVQQLDDLTEKSKFIYSRLLLLGYRFSRVKSYKSLVDDLDWSFIQQDLLLYDISPV